MSVQNATNGTATLAGNTVTFTPNLNFNGTATFQYTVTDGALVDTGNVTVTVTAVNDAPLAVDDTAATAEDTAVNISTATVLANDTDVEGDTLTVTAVGNAQNGTVSLAGATITFTPSADFNGVASFEYTVSDGAATDIGVVNVTVTAVNDAPVAVDDTKTTAEDTALVFPASDLRANDTDVDNAVLTVTAVSNPTNGAVALAGGTITFTPTANFNGTASFDYTISDGSLTDIGKVTVTVTPVNDAPVAVDDVASTPEDTALVVSTSTVLANDTDVDNVTLTVTAVSNASSGIVNLVGTTITFTPDADFNGTAGFDYTVSDGTLTDVGTVTVTVIAVNDAPVAVDDAVAMQSNTSLVIATSTLLANDTDVDGPSLSIPLVLNPVNGTVSLAGTSITFTPNAAFVGAASFEYVVSDGSLTDVGLVTVTVSAGPICGDGVIAAPETCDDGNAASGDGCSATCQKETGFDCVGAPSVCTPICGDGIVIAGREACDDGNTDNTDGCTTQCVVGALCTSAQFPTGDRFNVDASTGHCYVSYDDEQTTFAAAQSACIAEGGYLVTITSATEDAVVRGVLNPLQSPWIGAVDDANDTDDIFVWVTNESFTFKHFAPGQPDDDIAFGGNGECLHILNAAGEWNDTNCNIDTFVVGRICEVEPNPCGDRILQTGEGEECDDGNRTSGDGCSATCQLETGCGNGVVDPGEECDDDNTVSGDGCSATCQIENGCGDGNIAPGEECDDDNVVSGDGCSSTCQVETGCGNGVLDPGEECDDDNLVSGDGCSATCQLEVGCGNGILDAGEQCDDDNIVSGDGCSSTCKLERLIFSEYVEGSASNKALEVKNLLNTPINLTGCSIKTTFNGGPTTNTLALTQTIAANDVVVFCNASAGATLLALCDVQVAGGITNFNGDDSIELTCGTTPMDIIGQVGTDPGTEWGSGLTSTADNTIRRRCSVTSGDTDGTNAFDPATEWAGFAVDTFAGVGDPTCEP
jgi:cysteine-rich repeat protein